MTIRLNDFQYELPERSIAQNPSAQREKSRLMTFSRPDCIPSDHRFDELPSLLRDDDLLVFNDTRVIPAKFACKRQTGGLIEGLFLNVRDDGSWCVLLKNAKRCHIGEQIVFDGDEQQGIELVENLGTGRWAVSPVPKGSAEKILSKVGATPLPPYIHRENLPRSPEDRERYQTVYAQNPGAVAAPTAGLHFTNDLLGQLCKKGIELVNVTLHVGLGTFEPVKTNDLTRHDMHSEYYELSPAAADAINLAKSQSRRIVAVGTTSVRVIESVTSSNDGKIVPATGDTKLFLYPPAKFHVTDALITNFHLPSSTLLMLVAAFCDPGGTTGTERILSVYKQAVSREYRFFSYGDAMFIE
jgi:S-adenosylmethionine:tRNA ribosyltransferase-isomerase